MTIKRAFLLRLFLCFLLPFTLAHCTGYNFYDEEKATQQQILQFSSQAHDRILASYNGPYRNLKIEALIRQIMTRLAKASGDRHQIYHIILLNSPRINAFALPDGFVYITRGLLALTCSSSQVAAIFAHEMAHIIAHHGFLRHKKAEEIAFSRQFLRRAERSETLRREQILLAQFSRQQELEADAIGIKLLHKAGYDPFALAEILQTMQDYARFYGQTHPTKKIDFLASHPATPERIRQAVTLANTYGNHKTTETLSSRNNFIQKLDGMPLGEVTSKAYICMHQFISPKWHIKFDIPARFLINWNDNTLLSSGPHDTAIRFDSLLLPQKQTAAEYLASGWVSGLKNNQIVSLDLNNMRALANILETPSAYSTTLASPPPKDQHLLSAAYAPAENENWRFDVFAVIKNKRAFRFILACPKNISGLHNLTQNLISSFQLLTQQQLAQLKPLRIRTRIIQKNDTLEKLAQRMHKEGSFIENKNYFCLMNGIEAKQKLPYNLRVKLVMP